jgi:transposase
MSLPLPGPDSIPEETARLARTICPKGTLYMRIRDQLGVIYENQSFASLFSTRGQPAEAPWRLALGYSVSQWWIILTFLPLA